MEIKNKRYKEKTMKRVIFSMIVLMLGLSTIVSANEPIGVFANLNTNCIQFIDPTTNNVSDHLFKGELGHYGGGLLDVVITSNGKTAIVSNFGDSKIFFIDISGGFNAQPTLLGSTFVSLFAEDMAITPDDRYVLVTDGGLSSRIAVVDIASRTLVYIQNIGGSDAQAIAITPDGQLVLVADYLGGQIHSYTIDSNGYLSFKETQNVLPSWPVNLAISPDGKTVIVPSAFRSTAPVFLIDSQHNLVFKELISLPARGAQSCVFSSDGTKAYLLTNGNPGLGTQVHIMNVTSPGKVSASGTSIQVTPARGTGQFFGVDTIALDPSEHYLYVTNPTSFGVTVGISVIDLTINTEVEHIKGIGIPTGITFATIKSDNHE
jgi:DNA-binding beta-propeller fold protein YncE